MSAREVWLPAGERWLRDAGDGSEPTPALFSGDHYRVRLGSGVETWAQWVDGLFFESDGEKRAALFYLENVESVMVSGYAPRPHYCSECGSREDLTYRLGVARCSGCRLDADESNAKEAVTP